MTWTTNNTNLPITAKLTRRTRGGWDDTWHSYAPSSLSLAYCTSNFQSFGSSKSKEYRESLLYVWWPNVINVNWSPFLRIQDTVFPRKLSTRQCKWTLVPNCALTLIKLYGSEKNGSGSWVVVISSLPSSPISSSWLLLLMWVNCGNSGLLVYSCDGGGSCQEFRGKLVNECFTGKRNRTFLISFFEKVG